MTDTIGYPGDDWIDGLFTETEIAKMRQQADDVLNEIQAENETQDVSVEIMLERSVAKEIVAWLREQHAEYATGPSSDFVWAAGVNVCFAYLVDDTWDYDEEMSDHATYFGAREWFQDE